MSSGDDDDDVARQLRVLRRKLSRSERHRTSLEMAKELSERMLRRLIDDHRRDHATLEARNLELEAATRRLVDANKALQEVHQLG